MTGAGLAPEARREITKKRCEQWLRAVAGAPTMVGCAGHDARIGTPTVEQSAEARERRLDEAAAWWMCADSSRAGSVLAIQRNAPPVENRARLDGGSARRGSAAQSPRRGCLTACGEISGEADERQEQMRSDAISRCPLATLGQSITEANLACRKSRRAPSAFEEAGRQGSSRRRSARRPWLENIPRRGWRWHWWRCEASRRGARGSRGRDDAAREDLHSAARIGVLRADRSAGRVAALLSTANGWG